MYIPISAVPHRWFQCGNDAICNTDVFYTLFSRLRVRVSPPLQKAASKATEKAARAKNSAMNFNASPSASGAACLCRARDGPRLDERLAPTWLRYGCEWPWWPRTKPKLPSYLPRAPLKAHFRKKMVESESVISRIAQARSRETKWVPPKDQEIPTLRGTSKPET